MKTKIFYFWILIIFAILIDTVGDISSKFAAVKNKNIYLIVAISLYILSTFIWAISLRHNDLSKATVIFNTLNVIAVVFAGVLIFKESLTTLNIVGIVLGIISVVLLSI